MPCFRMRSSYFPDPRQEALSDLACSFRAIDLLRNLLPPLRDSSAEGSFGDWAGCSANGRLPSGIPLAHSRVLFPQANKKDTERFRYINALAGLHCLYSLLMSGLLDGLGGRKASQLHSCRSRLTCSIACLRVRMMCPRFLRSVCLSRQFPVVYQSTLNRFHVIGLYRWLRILFCRLIRPELSRAQVGTSTTASQHAWRSNRRRNCSKPERYAIEVHPC